MDEFSLIVMLCYGLLLPEISLSVRGREQGRATSKSEAQRMAMLRQRHVGRV
jgi:hypothetical protein